MGTMYRNLYTNYDNYFSYVNRILLLETKHKTTNVIQLND